MRPRKRKPNSCRARALTLVELVISCAASAILLGGMASAVVLASRALPQNSTELEGVVEVANFAEQFTSELSTATAITARSATSITFTIPDRDGDATPETISYEWLTKKGDPVQRTYKGGGKADVLTDVQDFALTYDLYALTRTPPPTQTEGAETLLTSYTSTPGASTVSLASPRWYGQQVRIVLAADAVGWCPTRVQFYGQRDGTATGTYCFELRTGDSTGRPTSCYLAHLDCLETGLPSSSWGWVDYSMPGAARLPSGEVICMVAGYVSNPNAGRHQYQSTVPASSGARRLESADGGASWTTSTGQRHLFALYGTITTRTTGTPVTVTQLREVRLQLRVGSGTNTETTTSVPLLNKPEVS